MNQKELKAEYERILASEVWSKSPDMVEYCVKEAAHIVELTDGSIVVIEKPRIKKNFCFGYRDSRYDTEEYDEANRMAAHASSSTDYFLVENLAAIDDVINHLEGKKRDSWEYHLRVPYSGQPEGSKLKCLQEFYWHDEHGQKYPKLEGENRYRVLEGYKAVRASFEKRLHTYLKRYGMSKVNTWSYWVDA